MLVCLGVCLYVTDKRQNGPELNVGSHMSTEKVHGTSKLDKNYWKIFGMFFENAPNRQKTRPSIKWFKVADFQSEQQLKAKIIYRKEAP